MMFFVSDIFTSAPEQFSTPLQKTVYGTLAAFNAKLDMKMVNFMTVEV